MWRTKAPKEGKLRRTLLIAVIAAVGITGVAYAASKVTNHYVLKAKVTPTKSGTKQHPIPIATQISYTVSAVPKGDRPNVVKSEEVTIQGVQANTNDFKACDTSRLINPSEGPSTCPKGSQIGTGYFMAEIGPSSSQSSKMEVTCRVDLTVFNGSNHKIIYYIYRKTANKNECPATPNLPTTMVASLKQTNAGLVQSFTIPEHVRHPTVAGSNVPMDSAPVSAVVNVPAATTTVKKHKIGLVESISCPTNHQRQIAITFKLENGSSHVATRLVPCS